MEKKVADKYPQDFSSAFEIAQTGLGYVDAQFATYDIALGLDNYIQARKGEKTGLGYVEPIAIKMLGWLMKDSALRYFESKNNRAENMGGFIDFNVFEIILNPLKDYSRTNKVDEIMLQIYLGGKEFQRFENFDIEKLEELRDFSIELSKMACFRFYEQGGFKRYFVA